MSLYMLLRAAASIVQASTEAEVGRAVLVSDQPIMLAAAQTTLEQASSISPQATASIDQSLPPLRSAFSMTSAERSKYSLEKDCCWATDVGGTLGDACSWASANRASRAATSAAIAERPRAISAISVSIRDSRAASSLAAISASRSSAVARSAPSVAALAAASARRVSRSRASAAARSSSTLLRPSLI
eukprot:772877-Rhodomonas_salina.2